jgi:hypothetical protein
VPSTVIRERNRDSVSSKLIAVALLREHIPVLVGPGMAVAVVLLVVYSPVPPAPVWGSS